MYSVDAISLTITIPAKNDSNHLEYKITFFLTFTINLHKCIQWHTKIIPNIWYLNSKVQLFWHWYLYQGGSVSCSKKPCPVQKCSHPIMNQCCPECTDCLYEGVVIRHGESHRKDVCHTCSCRVGIIWSVLTCDSTVVIIFNYKSDHTVKLVKYDVNMYIITNSQI